MKILEVTFHLASGGAERFVVDLSNELAKSNDVTVLALRDDSVNPEVRNFYKGDLAANVHYECLGLKDGLRPSMWWKICQYINKHKPEIVHYHGDPMPFWMLVPMIFSSKKIKYVQTIHSDIHNGYDTFIYRWLVRLLGNNHRVRFVALSDTNYHELMSLYPNVCATCIVNGRSPMSPTGKWDEVASELAAYRHTSKTKLFLHVARCDVVKNQNRLIRVFNQLEERGYDAELLIIGAGYDEQLGIEMYAMANKHIHFLGIRKNIADYMLLTDVFCLSSDFEGMPISLIEALLCGTPAVSTPVCGSVDAIKSGINGYLSTSFSDEDYLQALISSYDNWNTIKKNAMEQKDICPYTIKECAEKYLNFFKE